MPNIKTRIVNKHDISDNWANSTGFVPMNGEIIIYSADSNTPYPRFKVGNGEDTPNELPFSSVEYMTDNEVDALFN